MSVDAAGIQEPVDAPSGPGSGVGGRAGVSSTALQSPQSSSDDDEDSLSSDGVEDDPYVRVLRRRGASCTRLPRCTDPGQVTQGWRQQGLAHSRPDEWATHPSPLRGVAPNVAADPRAPVSHAVAHHTVLHP